MRDPYVFDSSGSTFVPEMQDVLNYIRMSDAFYQCKSGPNLKKTFWPKHEPTFWGFATGG